MHDSKNALSVQNLIAELAGTVRIMDEKDQQSTDALESPSQPFLDTWTTAFWETVCREWVSIDQWRMNKVLLLVRFYVRETFNLALCWALSEDSTSDDRVVRQIQILETWPLSPRERKVPDGLRLHVLDIWVDELAGQLTAARKTVEETEGISDGKKAILADIARVFMLPVEKIGKEGLGKAVKIRAKEAIKNAGDRLSD